MDDQVIWMIVGFAGQALFASSFLVQWVHSERKQRSLMPQAFWYLRASGGVVLRPTLCFAWIPSLSSVSSVGYSSTAATFI